MELSYIFLDAKGVVFDGLRTIDNATLSIEKRIESALLIGAEHIAEIDVHVR